MSFISSKRMSERTTLPWLAYAMGFFGLFLIKSAVVAIAIYRYDPGPSEGSLPLLVPAALVGFTFFFARFAGAIMQPVAGYCSDRTQGRWGKRRPFLAIATLPLVASFVLLFNPLITATSQGNSLYLLVFLCLFYLAFALYQVPYLAWLPELASDEQQRVTLAKWIAITSLVGSAIGGAGAPWMIGQFGFGGMSAIIATLSLATLLLPLLTPEVVARRSQPVPFLTTLRQSWNNKTFRVYALSVGSAWITVTILSICSPFFAIALLQQDIGYSAVLNGLVLLGSAVGMLSVKPLVKRWGKKRAFQLSMLWTGGWLVLLAILSASVLSSLLAWLLLLPLGSLGLASFFILPNAMMPDVVEQDRTLNHSARAVYFGSRGLIVEMSIGLGGLIVGLLLSFGKTVSHPLGVQLSLVAAGLFALTSAGFLITYPISK